MIDHLDLPNMFSSDPIRTGTCRTDSWSLCGGLLGLRSMFFECFSLVTVSY